MKKKSSFTNPLTLFLIKVKFRNLFLILSLVVNFTTFSQITAINEILKDIDSKKQQLPKHYSELVTIYQNKQTEITGKLETLETNHKLEIYKKEVNINELKTEYLKYKKQGSLYKSIKTFCDDHKNYEMQLYENKADCKRIKKRFTTGFKKVKLLFAVFASAQPGMDRKMHNRDLLYFWSDSSITIESNFNSYLPDYLLSNKIQAWPFLNYSGNRILENLNTQLFIKLISYIDYKKPLEINEKIIDLTNEINASNLKFNEEKLSLSSIKQTFSMDTLKKHRAGDSLTLLTLENYYKLEYPSLMKKYNESLILTPPQKKLMEDYNEKKNRWNAFLIKDIGQDEANAAFTYLKQNTLRDPYSSMLLSYQLPNLPLTKKRFPNIKVLKLKIRGQNTFGAYINNYFYVYLLPFYRYNEDKFVYVAMAAYDEPENPIGGLDYFLSNSLTLKLTLESERGTIWTEEIINSFPTIITDGPPVKTNEKPVMKDYIFAFHN